MQKKIETHRHAETTKHEKVEIHNKDRTPFLIAFPPEVSLFCNSGVLARLPFLCRDQRTSERR